MSEQDLKAFFDKVAREYRYRAERYLRPAAGADGSAPPSPLMTWWLLLYSFSILARYEPGAGRSFSIWIARVRPC